MFVCMFVLMRYICIYTRIFMYIFIYVYFPLFYIISVLLYSTWCSPCCRLGWFASSFSRAAQKSWILLYGYTIIYPVCAYSKQYSREYLNKYVIADMYDCIIYQLYIYVWIYVYKHMKLLDQMVDAFLILISPNCSLKMLPPLCFTLYISQCITRVFQHGQSDKWKAALVNFNSPLFN